MSDYQLLNAFMVNIKTKTYYITMFYNMFLNFAHSK